MSEQSYLNNFTTAQTLVDLLRTRASESPNTTAYDFLVNQGEQSLHVTYGELDRQARAIAASMQSFQCVGERALLLYAPGLDYIAAFFGCLYAGVVAVPCYPPRARRTDTRLQTIARSTQADFVLSTRKFFSSGEQWLAQMPELKDAHWLLTDEIAVDEAIHWRQPVIDTGTLAFLQYTSGSTRLPRGVMLTHENLLHNLYWIRQYLHIQPHSRAVSWLPPYHDMGLIGGILQPLYSGIPAILYSPTAFLEQPLRWLEVISRTRATISGGPNFAYDLCARKAKEQERAKLDLSCWEVAFSGAEPIRAETLERFARTFEPCGFRREALFSSYGLAEATLLVSAAGKGHFPVIRSVDSAALQCNQVQVATSIDTKVQVLVGCGKTVPDQTTIIVNPVLRTCCQRNQVGEIWVAGQSVAQGYWQQPEDTTQTFAACLADGKGPFLRTGDLGFIDDDDQLFITGRLKDLIVIRGRNCYPQDIELTVEHCHQALRAGSCAAFSVDIAGEERLVVVQELERQFRFADCEEVAVAIRQRVAEAHELHVYAVVLIKPGSLPKTSSGKVQRQYCRALFLEQRLSIVAQSVFGGELTVTNEVADDEMLLHRLNMMPDQAGRRDLAVRFLQQRIAHLFAIAPENVDVRQPLNTFGLDSLMAVELKNSIEVFLGVIIPINMVLEGMNTIQLVETMLSRHDHFSTSSELAATPAERVPARFPLASNQRALWFLHQLMPDDMAYVITRVLHMRGMLDSAAFQRAWQRLVQRHSALRTVFMSFDGEPLQAVREESAAFFFTEDASTWSEEQLLQRLTQEAQRPFDLEHGPLLRVLVFALSPEDHILLFMVHHIAIDFWSLVLLLRELKDLYMDERSGKGKEPAFQYYDYICWQAEMLQGPTGERAWAYWQKQLAGCRSVVTLPTDQPRQSVGARRGNTFSFTLPASLARKLKECASSHHTTLYATLMAAFAALLYRYSGQPDMLIGTSIAGRNRASFMDIAGYFINPLAIRIRPEDSLRFTTFLQQVSQTLLSALEFQDFPFIELVNRLRPERNVGHSPLFDVMFTFQQAPSSGDEVVTALAAGASQVHLDWGNLSLELLPFEQHTAQFDLLLTMAECNGTLVGSFQYDTDLFFPATIERFASHFQTLLESLVADPEQRLSEARIVSQQESRQLLTEWNTTSVSYPRALSVHALFEAQVERQPNQIAVRYEDQWLTYRELNQQANRLARYLQGLGVGPEVGVGLCLRRSPNLVVGILGILKAGGYYIPLDPQYPSARLSSMLTDAHVAVVLTERCLSEKFMVGDAHLLCMDTDQATSSAEDASNLIHVHNPEQLAYVIYTSGSTGRPKGVMIAHHSLVNYLTWCQQAYPLHAGREVPVHSSVAFDLTVTSLLAPLLTGQQVRLLPEERQLEALVDSFREGADFSLVKLTPLHLQLLGEQLAGTYMHSIAHAFVIGGEALRANHIAFWRSAAPTIDLMNEYGPTEAVVGCCMYRIPANHDPESVIPIGRPIANVRLYILDRSMQSVPIGVPGELYIGGVGLARGYHNQPDLTAERFLPDPFSGEIGARLYKTGDRVRYRADGVIEYLGRDDNQVKIRGFRVELEEIEAVLSLHPDVRHAVVMTDEDDSGAHRLIAWVVPAHEQPPAVEALRTFVREYLPDYMTPTTILVQTSIPVTLNGKADRSALLRTLPTVQHRQVKETDIPRTDIERAIGSIWKTILKIDQAGIHENFFDLGGHSLLMVQMQKQLQEYFHREIPLLEIVNHPTINTLAAFLQQKDHAGAGEVMARVSIEQSKARAENRLTAMQLRQRYQKGRK